jgi:predicted membrane protein
MSADPRETTDRPDKFVVLGDRPTHHVTPRLVVGICLALLGGMLLLDNLHVFHAREVLRFWPLGIIAVGLVVFSQAIDTGGRVNGGAMVFFGGLLLLDKLHLLQVDFWNLFWPLVLILVGANLTFQTFRPNVSVAGANANETVSLFAVWGGSKRTSNSPRFRGGDMTAVMGGCHLDLRQATIPPGESATIDVLAVMGGHEIFVPPDWSVVTRVFPLMGGVEDKTVLQKGATSTLVLRGFVMMGGVEIKN